MIDEAGFFSDLTLCVRTKPNFQIDRGLILSIYENFRPEFKCHKVAGTFEK